MKFLKGFAMDPRQTAYHGCRRGPPEGGSRVKNRRGTQVLQCPGIPHHTKIILVPVLIQKEII